jgi:hypothetical protein
MTKWLITRLRRKRGWEIVNFTGPLGRESRGIVDFLAIRKDHRASDVARGDYFEMILIQVKGGGAGWPTLNDIERLRTVQRRYGAREVVLAVWQPGAKPVLHRLRKAARGDSARNYWIAADEPSEIFA